MSWLPALLKARKEAEKAETKKKGETGGRREEEKESGA